MGYQYDLLHGLVKLNQNRWKSILQEVSSDLLGQKVHVSSRPFHSNGETGPSWKGSYETHSIAPQKELKCSRITGKLNSSSKVSSPAPPVVDQAECPTRSTLAPNASCHQVFTDASKESWVLT